MTMKFAYADPPYPGQAKKHYNSAEVDHRKLLKHLRRYDGWALSTSSPALYTLLPLCEQFYGREVRIGAWVKPFCAFKRGIRPAYAWEPVLFWGGRNKNHPPPPKGGKATTPKDFVSEVITLKRGMVGVKPEKFCLWIFDILGMHPTDDFYDLFPGTGAVSRAWETWADDDTLSKKGNT